MRYAELISSSQKITKSEIQKQVRDDKNVQHPLLQSHISVIPACPESFFMILNESERFPCGGHDRMEICHRFIRSISRHYLLPVYYLLHATYCLFESLDLFLHFIRCGATLGLSVSNRFLRPEKGENVGRNQRGERTEFL